MCYSELHSSTFEAIGLPAERVVRQIEEKKRREPFEPAPVLQGGLLPRRIKGRTGAAGVSVQTLQMRVDVHRTNLAEQAGRYPGWPHHKAFVALCALRLRGAPLSGLLVSRVCFPRRCSMKANLVERAGRYPGSAGVHGSSGYPKAAVLTRPTAQSQGRNRRVCFPRGHSMKLDNIRSGSHSPRSGRLRMLRCRYQARRAERAG